MCNQQRVAFLKPCAVMALVSCISLSTTLGRKCPKFHAFTVNVNIACTVAQWQKV